MDDGERGVTSLVLYLLQAGATEDRFQYSSLFCHRDISIHWSTQSKGSGEEQKVTSTDRIDFSLHKDNDGINKKDSSEGHKRGYQVL